MGILDEHKQMRKITMNRTRLSNVVDNFGFAPTADNNSREKRDTSAAGQEKKKRVRAYNLQLLIEMVGSQFKFFRAFCERDESSS